MNPILLVAFYLAVTLAPLVLAQSLGFAPRHFWDELATGAGLLALAILLVEFVLSGRFRAVSGRVGMDVTMRYHQLLARTAAVFLLVHPFVYRTGIASYPDPSDVTNQLTIGLEKWSFTSGVLAWLLSFVVIIFALFRDNTKLNYETWRRWHGVGALMIVILAVHHAVAAGRYSSQAPLAWYWIALLGVAILSIAWVYLVRPYRQLQTPYVVKSVKKIALKTWELIIAPKGSHELDYNAGQFVWLNIGNSPFSLNENPFSISTAPVHGPEIGFVIKELGDFTSGIGRVQPGAVAYIDGAHGTLTLADRAGEGIALVAGGVGIAPLIGILRELAAKKDGRPIILVYGNRTAEQIAYEQELEALAKSLRLKIEYILSEPPPDWSGHSGLTDAILIKDLFSFEGSDRWLYFLCGPPAMLETVEEALVKQGVPATQVVSERFNYD